MKRKQHSNEFKAKVALFESLVSNSYRDRTYRTFDSTAVGEALREIQ
uniref:Uncharacterized protein n=1 Tax=Candidatus Kentrum sp. TC TaxID=2126339 RepID=A0A450ZYF9_9GAMM|nr:MAG: hypothetical protein BECKTC1821F_GA0114240_10272 [Candidatus Kentron sp. TC]